ncbi:hypothetical protein [Peribacillus muralis]|nr:hypothetical protein [Peribacillus muralis]
MERFDAQQAIAYPEAVLEPPWLLACRVWYSFGWSGSTNALD